MPSRRLLLHGVLVGGIGLAFSLQAWIHAAPAEPNKGYELDPGASRVYIKVGSATRFGHEHGVDGRIKSGKLNFSTGGEWVFDMPSFTADTAEARRRVGLGNEKVSDSDARKVTQTMRGADVLDVARFPTATLVLTTITPLDRQAPGAPGTYQIEGKFTLHGSERKIQFKAKVETVPQAASLKMIGSFAIKQSDYGIKPYSMFGGVVKVADSLEITGDLLLTVAQ
jgi:polyisoprenoid-binding protein YceI